MSSCDVTGGFNNVSKPAQTKPRAGRRGQSNKIYGYDSRPTFGSNLRVPITRRYRGAASPAHGSLQCRFSQWKEGRCKGSVLVDGGASCVERGGGGEAGAVQEGGEDVERCGAGREVCVYSVQERSMAPVVGLYHRHPHPGLAVPPTPVTPFPVLPSPFPSSRRSPPPLPPAAYNGSRALAWRGALFSSLFLYERRIPQKCKVCDSHIG